MASYNAKDIPVNLPLCPGSVSSLYDNVVPFQLCLCLSSLLSLSLQFYCHTFMRDCKISSEACCSRWFSYDITPTDLWERRLKLDSLTDDVFLDRYMYVCGSVTILDYFTLMSKPTVSLDLLSEGLALRALLVWELQLNFECGIFGWNPRLSDWRDNLSIPVKFIQDFVIMSHLRVNIMFNWEHEPAVLQ